MLSHIIESCLWLIVLVLAVINMLQIVIIIVIVIIIIIILLFVIVLVIVAEFYFLERALFWVGILLTLHLSRLIKRTLFTIWRGVTCQRAGTFNSTAVRTSESHTVRFNFTLMRCHHFCNCQLTNSFSCFVCLWPVCVQRNFIYI